MLQEAAEPDAAKTYCSKPDYLRGPRILQAEREIHAAGHRGSQAPRDRGDYPIGAFITRRRQQKRNWLTGNAELLPWYNDHAQIVGFFPMKKMAAGSFKVHCLAVMDEVRTRKESVLITKHGKPVAKLVPIGEEADEIYGFLAGKGSIVGDVVAPAMNGHEWGELK